MQSALPSVRAFSDRGENCDPVIAPLPGPSPVDVLIRLLSDQGDLSAVQDKESWTMIRKHAARYGVAPLVAYVARRHISPAERVWCDQVLIDSWIRQKRMLRHLEYLLGLLNAEGIPAISLKGPLLAQRYYTPAFLRKPATDLDVAVMEQDLGRACDVLIRVGYKQDQSIANAMRTTHHVTLTHPSRPRVELHFRLTHLTLGIPVAEFFDRAVSCNLPNGQEALVLSPADQLLHLMLHFAHNRFGTLFHLYEIRKVLRAESAAVRAEAVRRAVDNRFCGVLHMIDVAFRARWNEPFLSPDVEVPATWLNSRLNQKLYMAFERWWTPGRGLTLAARTQGRWLDLQITDSPSDALRWILLLAQTARFEIASHTWRTSKTLAGGPEYATTPTRAK